MNYKFTKKLKKKHKISSGTKENLDTIIDELSFITRRKGLAKNEPSKVITEALNKTDHHIAAISLILPEIDQLWQNSGARMAFLKIKRYRLRIMRLLISLAIIISIIALASSLVAVFLLEDWKKWVILIPTLLLLLLISFGFSKIILTPIITKKDNSLPTKFPKEIEIINNFIRELIAIRR